MSLVCATILTFVIIGLDVWFKYETDSYCVVDGGSDTMSKVLYLNQGIAGIQVSIWVMIIGVNIITTINLRKKTMENSSGDSGNQNSNLIRQLQASVTLVVMSVSFALLSLPDIIRLIWFAASDQVPVLKFLQSSVLWDISLIALLINRSTNVIFFSICGKSFRDQLRKMIACRFRHTL